MKDGSAPGTGSLRRSVLQPIAAPSVLGLYAFTGATLIVAAGLAWHTASAMMLAATAGRIVLPLGTYTRTGNVPGRTPTTAVELEYGEPGVEKGQ